MSTAFKLITLLVALPLAQAAAQDAQSERLVIRGVRIFDGVQVLEAQDVAIADGKLVEIGEALAAREGYRELDGAGQTLLPGLIDAHTHTISPEIQEQSLALGVTTELDMFASWQMARGIKQRQAEGLNANRSDLFSAGTLVTSPGGHGTEYGVPIPTIERPEEAQAFVDARIAEGSDYIKIVYDDGRVYGLSIPTIDKATLGAVIEAAHQRNKLAVVHIGSYQGAWDAVELGADGLVHMFFEVVDDAAIGAFVELVVSHGAFVMPTMSVLESVSGTPSGAELAEDERIAPYVDAEWRSNLKRSFPSGPSGKQALAVAMKTTRALATAGVSILAGSDAPNPGTAHGASMHRELELLVHAGLTPVEALRAATSEPALRFGLKDRGTLAVGMRADLLLVNGDPTTDVLATHDIVAIWKRGVLVDRAAVRASVATRAAVASKPASGDIGDGRVSDFESGEARANFGAGWSISTDALMGGKSTADLLVVEDGANGTSHSLHVIGEVQAGSTPWAGAMFSPGERPMVPVDLSSMSTVSFWAKGKPGTYDAMMFLQSMGFAPAVQRVEVTEEWRQFTFELSSFGGTDGRDVTGFYFGGSAPGALAFWIDEVRFAK